MSSQVYLQRWILTNSGTDQAKEAATAPRQCHRGLPLENIVQL
jgi:hypothetical protein